jgi:NRAMP (natural resistance-associated macrophage protein)-like metal ion transporter
MPKEKDLIERLVEAPAKILDEALESSKNVGEQASRPIRRASNFWKMLGPGLTTGAADDDPSGIATYSQTGAQYGFQLLWLSLFTFPLMAVIQEMCARIGLVTGKGLAANIRKHYPRWVLYTCTILLFTANTLNLGADLGAMAKAVQLIAPSTNFPTLVVGFALLSVALQIFTAYEKYAKYLKWLAMILLAYVFVALVVPINWAHVVQSTLLPRVTFSKQQIFLICAILGTTISPYLFFWQTSQEIEEEILKGKTSLKSRQGASVDEIKEMRVDVWSGMFVSNLIMFFIIAACAATLNANGITHINTAADAAEALRPIAGESAYLLFALGIIGTGLLAVPVLAGSSSYAISESMGWKFGLYRRLKEAYAFYGIIIISSVIGIIINLIGVDPIKTLLYSAVLNGMVAPVMLILIVLLASSKKIMGDHVNSSFTSILGWIVTLVMVIAGGATLVSLFIG